MSFDFDPALDCQAIKGFGCDSRGIFKIVCLRSAAQRQDIRRLFHTMYGMDLIKELIDQLKGKLEDVIVALMSTPAEYDARSLRYAMEIENMGTNVSILVEVLASRTNAEIHDIRAAYQLLFGRDLERDVESGAPKHCKRLCVSLLQGGREESGRTDPVRASQDATRLYQAGEKKIGTDESTFNAIVCAQNFNQLRLFFQEYQKVSGHDLEEAITAEFSGDAAEGFLAIVKVARNAPIFFAELLYLSVGEQVTKHSQLIRGVVTRAEVDMPRIKAEFRNKYGKNLEFFLETEISGAYKFALLTLISDGGAAGPKFIVPRATSAAALYRGQESLEKAALKAKVAELESKLEGLEEDAESADDDAREAENDLGEVEGLLKKERMKTNESKTRILSLETAAAAFAVKEKDMGAELDEARALAGNLARSFGTASAGEARLFYRPWHTTSEGAKTCEECGSGAGERHCAACGLQRCANCLGHTFMEPEGRLARVCEPCFRKLEAAATEETRMGAQMAGMSAALLQFQELGFTDENANLQALIEAGGSLERALVHLLEKDALAAIADIDIAP